MFCWPVGISTGCFYKSSLRDSLPVLAHSEFRLLEVSTSPSHVETANIKLLREISHFLLDNGIKVCSVHAPFSQVIDTTSPVLGEREFSQQKILESLDAAAVLNADFLVFHPWPEKTIPPHSEELRERKTNAAEFIRSLAIRCKDLGVKLAIENMQPQLLISPLKDLMWIRHETEESNVAACFDTGHAFISGNLGNAINELSSHIAMVHASDNWGKKDDHLVPGEGGIDWKNLIVALKKINFKGPIIIELNDADHAKPSEVLKKASDSADYLRTLIDTTIVPDVGE